MERGRGNAEQLIESLLSDPSGFNARGQGYELLQEYFRGHPLESLRQLLANPDPEVQRAALFVASELPAHQAGALYRDVIPLLSAVDVRLVYEAMEVIAIGCVGGPEYSHLLRQLEHPDARIRVLAMFLATRSDSEQLRGAIRGAGSFGARRTEHEAGIHALADANPQAEKLVEWLGSSNSLERKYAAVGIARAHLKVPGMKQRLLDSRRRGRPRVRLKTSPQVVKHRGHDARRVDLDDEASFEATVRAQSAVGLASVTSAARGQYGLERDVRNEMCSEREMLRAYSAASPE